MASSSMAAASTGPRPPSAEPTQEDRRRHDEAEATRIEHEKPLSGRGVGISGWMMRATALMVQVGWLDIYNERKG
jgi:hypothetical protein